MERSFARRLIVSSLVAAGAMGGVSACSSQPELPPSTKPIHVAAKPPPPISGGTLLVTHQNVAVAADSDRDVVWLVDLASKTPRQVKLQEGDEPGRVAEDGAGRVHVGLRGAGEIATIDVATGKLVSRTPVCASPRGIAYDDGSDALHVACAGGDLVTLSATTLAVQRTLHLDRDLRDVIVQNDRLLVTRFRSAEILVINDDGAVLNRQTPPALGGFGGFEDFGGGSTFKATVAWRAVPLAGGGAAVVHQRSATAPIIISEPDGYGGGGDPCGDGSIVNSTVTTVDGDGNAEHVEMPAPSILGATVPVDLATDGLGGYALASAGTDTVFLFDAGMLASGSFACGGGQVEVDPGGQPVAVASSDNVWIAQTREPAGLAFIQGGEVTRIELGGDSVMDTGHDLFHHAASATTHLACASCHPEGDQDNHVWVFETIGARRTQTVAGGVLDTAPLHWDGDLADLGSIMHEVFEHRMGGSPQGPRHIGAFASWIQTIRAPVASPRGEASQIDRGKELFFNEEVGCATCHSGRHFTNNENKDVGTGRAFQVPTLVGIGSHGPFMHDGCAPTLRARFDATNTKCGGGDLHGKTSHLSSSDIDALVAYLETL